MNNLNIYAVSGFVPNEEETVYVDVYQLIGIGQKEGEDRKYYWTNIVQGSGIGFALHRDKAGYETTVDALIGIQGFIDKESRIGKWTFEEMLLQYTAVKERLGLVLQDRQAKSSSRMHLPPPN